MTPGARPWLLVGLGVALACYGWFDVRQRARIDRGAKFHRTDFTVYQAAARALKTGEDAYEARNPRGYRYVYPPFFATLLLPIADWDPANAATLFFAVSVLLLISAFTMLATLPGVRGVPLGWRAVVVGVVLCMGFLHQSFQRGQVTIALVALHVLAMSAIAKRRWFAAALVLSLAGAIRLTPFLSVGAVGLGLLRQGWRPVVGWTAGALVGVLLAFVVVPWVTLGAGAAKGTTQRWWSSTRQVYGAGMSDTDLMREYQINEYRFKNQSPRRVGSTWAGWVTDAAFEKERPSLSDGAAGVVQGATWGVALLAVLVGIWWTLRAFGSSDAAMHVVALAWLGFLPVLITRYAWPTHYVAALPVLVCIAAGERGRDRAALWVFLVGALAFYAAYARSLQPVGAAGPLLLAAGGVLALQWPRRAVQVP